ncbi:TadE/TadG family type IV pilus assembly protein [Vibrio coralliilyticus]|uniref:TadE/TadG family type IV pilus assembly protein n=1 Tax=Vibrio coralliilyticus TaxID=190893 RepID=UPI001560ABCF|nr:TadE/TadG family type IV pilus assembly protein [Vibrio coralliilyticus]NRF16230.1 pilus assembly protein [Vibrio coralliilyticus]
MRISNSPTNTQSGFAAVEMALITPFMLVMIGGIIEVTQLLQSNSVMIGMSREAANLVSRTSTNTPDEIMTLVATTSAPLDMNSDGVMYITLVVGQESADPYVSEQYVWSNSGLVHSSSTWDQCTTWTNSQCELPDPLPELTDFPITLADNESVYVVEIHYEYTPLTNYLYDSSFVMSDFTYL